MSTPDRGVLGMSFLVACSMASYKPALEVHHTEVKPLCVWPRVFSAPWRPGQRWGWDAYLSEVTVSLSEFRAWMCSVWGY